MAKDANFSFYGNLPTFKYTRHCCGLIQNSTLYFILTALTIVQIIVLLLMVQVTKFQWGIPHNKFDTTGERMAVVIAYAIWLNIILISLTAQVKKMEWLHFPLIFVEVTFFFISCFLVGVFTWSITNSELKKSEHKSEKDFVELKLTVNALLAIYHGYYTYVIFCLWHDARKKRQTEEFITRQHMIDDVCEEMMWEEEEAQRYAELRTFPMSGIYQQENNLSIYSQSECSTSICSAEITINTLYNTYQQDRRFVTFYDDDENCCYY